MAHYLSFDGTDDYVSLASRVTILDDGTEADIVFRARYNGSGTEETWGIVGSTANRFQYTGSGFFLRLEGTNGLTVSIATIQGLIPGFSASDWHVYELQKRVPSRCEISLVIDGVDCGLVWDKFSDNREIRIEDIGAASSGFA